MLHRWQTAFGTTKAVTTNNPDHQHLQQQLILMALPSQHSTFRLKPSTPPCSSTEPLKTLNRKEQTSSPLNPEP